jgi:anti-sigma factor RsiW
MSGSRMRCQELVKFLSDFVDGELPEQQRAVFQEHLDRCKDCVDFVESFRATVRLEKESFCHPEEKPRAEPPPDLVNAILNARKHGD